MNLKRIVTPFALGLFKHKGSWRQTSGAWCTFEPYGFPETSKSSIRYSCQKLSFSPFCLSLFLIPIVSVEEEDKATKIFQRYGASSDSFIKFSTENVCPAVVTVSPEKGDGGSGIIIDSDGTVLTQARNVFSPVFRGKVNVSLHDRRKFSGNILKVNKYHDLALLKIQSEIPLPTIMFGSLGNYKRSELISVERLFREKDYPRISSPNDVGEEAKLMLSGEEIIPRWKYEQFYLGNCGGPIVTLDGELVGISTKIRLLKSLHNDASFGTIDAMGIEEALSNVGYTRKNDRNNNFSLAAYSWGD
ncbi:Putative protease Do-like 14 [Dendrobium catenatum]|uniref:Protease Do-like 14 n=1 Tax=Dendrobium catenatum TaxID=906689 RepID=A0A2I0WN50_9ASPA|nr:Putative protease Do-like 14 [Dendrobium catenatum]